MDTIFIKDLICYGTHGYTPKEQSKTQPFKVSVELDFESSAPAGTSDNIVYTIDYRVARTIIQEVIGTAPHQKLIESLAEMISARIFSALLGVKELRVTVTKIAIWENGQPGITIRRERQRPSVADLSRKHEPN